MALTLTVLPDRFAVCRLGVGEAVAGWVLRLPFYSVTRTADELSIVLPEAHVPDDWQAEKSWRCLKVHGPLDFGLTGILAGISGTLAQADISLFAISTYDTDYILVKEADLERAVQALIDKGVINGNPLR